MIKEDQKQLAVLAADCARKVLKYFEKERPKDKRPRQAIKAARDWASGKITVGEARKAALAAHAAAREAKSSSAIYAARSAGHAAATAHVAGHATHAAEYAIKAIKAASKK